MEARKRLYKAGPRDNPTLSERVKQNKNQRKNVRQDKFSAMRQIPVDESPGTPVAAQRNIQIKQIANRKEQLKAYRIAKNTQKFKEIQEQRSPFIPYVPSGRWVEKKSSYRPARLQLNETPVRAALMNERVLKKSTVKDLISKSTAKKENVMFFGKNSSKPQAAKAKKKILTELNAVMPAQSTIEEPPLTPLDLNSTFEISPDPAEKATEEVIVKLSKRRSKSLSDVVPKSKPIPIKKVVPVLRKGFSIKSKPLVKELSKKTPVIAKPVVKPLAAMKIVPKRVEPKETEKAPAHSSVEETQTVDVPQKPTAKKREPAHSKIYDFYKSSHDTQFNYISMQLDGIKKDQFEHFPEELQTNVNKAIQQGKVLLSEKLKKFKEFLEQHEDGLSSPDNPKRVTEEDVENYWYLLYDEIEMVKSELKNIRETGKRVESTQKKRRTRRTYVPDEGTPKKSQRIANYADTPKHNASCYGCVTVSASQKNTPKRRTTSKKSVNFDATAVIETPKRSEGRRSTRYHTATPKRNLLRMTAVDSFEESELDFESLA